MAKKNLTLKELKTSSNKNFESIFSDLKNAFMRDFTLERACRYAGIHHSTYYDWCEKSEEFEEEMSKAQDFLMNKADQVIVDEIVEKKNPDYAKWYKERRDKSRFSARIEQTGEDGKDLIENPFDKLPLDKKLKIKAIMDSTKSE